MEVLNNDWRSQLGNDTDRQFAFPIFSVVVEG